MKKICSLILVFLLVSSSSLGCNKICAFFRKKVMKQEGLIIPQDISENKFGFLSDGLEEEEALKEGIKERGARWARSYPGPFVWDMMQRGKEEGINFERTDLVVRSYGESGLGLLVTLWPFADWDQKKSPNAYEYRVSEKDKFLPKTGLKGINYLPYYRGNPNDWKVYKRWVRAVVERYDGDGEKDMPGLRIPVKYWEVLNEPDLASFSQQSGSESLCFYRGDASSYAKLLIETSEAIREADSSAKVLIAGASGGNKNSLDFYREVLKNKKVVSSFDIGNVHCISNDDYASFNVKPYKNLFEELGIEKPIWVTEAEALISDDPDINATQTLWSTRKALKLGAEKIFYTSFQFDLPPGKTILSIEKGKEITPELSGKDSIKAYLIITGKIKKDKVYLNSFSKGRISFNYPSGWKLISDVFPYHKAQDSRELKAREIVTVVDTGSSTQWEKFTHSVTVYTRKLPENTSLKEVFDTTYKALEDIPHTSFTPLSEKTTEVGGRLAYEKIYKMPWGEPWYKLRDVWLEEDGIVYIISCKGPPATFDKAQDDFNFIIESFKLR